MEKKWFHAKFRFEYPAQQWIDIFLIENIAPKLISECELWRFHRRHVNDEAQHQVSFYYWVEDGADISNYISESWPVVALRNCGLMINEEYGEAIHSDIASTSDPRWPDAVKRTWPYFICGACRAFVDLIPDRPIASDALLADIVELYNKKDEEMKDLFSMYGDMVFLHHVSVLYGSPWVTMIEKTVAIRF